MDDLPEQKLTVHAVVYDSYADDEVAGLYASAESAHAHADRLGGMWTVTEWTVKP